MGLRTGYGKIPTNGLVLFYDEGDKLNSFKGAPTTNLVIEPDGNANVLTSDVPFDTDVVGYAQYSSGYFVNPRNTTNVDTAGKTFTYSVYMRSRSATKSTYLMYVFTGNGPDGGWYYFGDGNLTSEWQRYTRSRSDMTGTLSQVTVYRYNQLGTIEIAAPQIEEKSYATQFIKGSRTNTQSLIDISGNSVLQLVNNTFDASGNLNFDGTNTYIQVDRDVLSSNSPYTLVTIMRPTNLSSLNDSFPQYNTYPSGFWHHMNSGGGIAWRHSGTNGNFGNHGMSNNQWGMHTISYDGTTLKLYANGELQNTTTSAGGYGNNGTGLARIGMLAQRNSGYDYNYNGVIPVNMVYNRALSQSEIFDIYEHFRPRYTLPNIKDGGTEAKAAPNAQHLYELGIRARGPYWIKPTGYGGSAQQVYCDFDANGGWMLVASNNTSVGTIPGGTARNNSGYYLNRSGVIGLPDPNGDYIIGSMIDSLSFSKVRILGWGFASINGTYTFPNNLGTYVTAEWNLTTTGSSRYTEKVARGNVTIGGNGTVAPAANYFVLDAVRNNVGFNANQNQSTIGGAGVQSATGDPWEGCYLGHGISEGSWEGWYDTNSSANDSQGYTTWVR
jgi:hypothetical protein